MRLLFCTTDGAGAFNGINAWLLEFLPALAAAGHEVRALVFAWSLPESCHTTPRLRALGVATEVVFPLPYTEAGVRRCEREAARFLPDVVVANHVLPALLALPSLRARGVRGVSVLHNDDDEYAAKAAFPADATVCISSGLARLVPADARLRRVIPYGVRASPRLAAAPGPGRPLRLVYHGRIARHQKRIVETAAALARVCRAHPWLVADLYGSGPDEAALREQLARDDADGRVRFLGRRDADQLRELLPDYHVAVLLSDFEGLGLSILEAMAAGLVPVCFRTESGLPDIVQHEENGLFVSDRESAFDAAITGLVQEPETWRRLSEGALATVHGRFSPASCMEAWRGLFLELKALPPTPTAPPSALPPPDPRLRDDDRRHPGLVRALWRRLRFGPDVAPSPW